MHTAQPSIARSVLPAAGGFAPQFGLDRVDLELPDLAAAPDAASAPAQLIEYARGRFAALPVHAAIELIDRPVAWAVPGATYYCDRLLAWRGQWLPLLNLEAMLAAYCKEHAAPLRYALVVAWQAAPGAPLAHGAIAMPSTPRVVRASDAAQCALPADSDLWPLLGLACFEHEGSPVPVLDTAALFRAFQG